MATGGDGQFVAMSGRKGGGLSPDGPPGGARTVARKKAEAVEPAESATVTVRVRDDCRYSTVQSAGLPWSRQPVTVRRDAPYLAELRACPYLEVSE
jgi:hypothetical protein